MLYYFAKRYASLCGLKDGKRSFSPLHEKIQTTHFNEPLFFVATQFYPIRATRVLGEHLPEIPMHTANRKRRKRMNLFLYIGVVKPVLTFFQQFTSVSSAFLQMFPGYVLWCDIKRNLSWQKSNRENSFFI